jgi:hypothetical protein
MSMKLAPKKEKTSSFQNQRSSQLRNSTQKFGLSPEKSESRAEKQ